MDKKMRQYAGIFAAVILYYIVHEGAHLLTALCLGVFRQINFLGLGVQIDVYAERMTAIQLGLFCLSGAAATTLAGWLLIALCKSVCRCRSDLFRAVMNLDKKYRVPILLFYYEGYSTAEIASILRIPEKTVSTRLFRAKAKLKDYLKEE